MNRYSRGKDRSSILLRSETLMQRSLRGLIYSVGVTREQIEKPFVAVVNTWNELHPGHFHLNRLASKVKEGVLMRGGMPFEFNTISVCDGIAIGHAGMRYVLPTRDVIADSIELTVEAHRFDAMVLVGSCDKILPGLLMAAARVDIPAIVVSGGPRFPGYWPRFDMNFSMYGLAELGKRYRDGEFSDEQLDELETVIMPCAGACWGMGTANTMACLSEAVGMSLPGDGTAHATTARKERFAVEAGAQVMSLLENRLCPSNIMTRNALENMLTVNAAIGGSLNTVLHIPAIAHELGIRIDFERFDAVSRDTPLLCSVEPSGPHFMSDLDKAGGVPGVMKRLESMLHCECRTVTGSTIGENLKRAEVFNDDVIRSLDAPVYSYGGIAVLTGNLAPDGAVIKQIAVDQALWTFEGPARVYDSEEDATHALMAQEIQPGDVIVIRYEGPKGGPGMREMALFRFYLTTSGFHDSVYIVTDGRFSGYTSGPCIGYLSPEAAEGGPIALVQNGDIISIDIAARKLDVRLSETELQQRRKRWTPPLPRITKGYLARYAVSASSASEGAIIK
jgi:dihydroxy-acid dehydratase